MKVPTIFHVRERDRKSFCHYCNNHSLKFEARGKHNDVFFYKLSLPQEKREEIEDLFEMRSSTVEELLELHRLRATNNQPVMGDL